MRKEHKIIIIIFLKKKLFNIIFNKICQRRLIETILPDM